MNYLHFYRVITSNDVKCGDSEGGYGRFGKIVALNDHRLKSEAVSDQVSS